MASCHRTLPGSRISFVSLTFRKPCLAGDFCRAEGTSGPRRAPPPKKRRGRDFVSLRKEATRGGLPLKSNKPINESPPRWAHAIIETTSQLQQQYRLYSSHTCTPQGLCLLSRGYCALASVTAALLVTIILPTLEYLVKSVLSIFELGFC